MTKTPHVQAGQIAPAQLSLQPDAFNSELLRLVATKKIGWTPDEHAQLVQSVLDHLVDENGKAPSLASAHKDRVRLIYRPSEDLQKSVLRQTFADAGYALSADAESTLVLLFSAAQFADFLAKTVNPLTGEAFITKEKKRGVKKSTFASLIGAVLPPPALAPMPVEESVITATEGEKGK